jgi:hypothetical protein
MHLPYSYLLYSYLLYFALTHADSLLSSALLFFTTQRPCFTLPYSYLPYFALAHSFSLLYSALLVVTVLLRCCSYEKGVQKRRRNSLTFVLRRIPDNARLLVPNNNKKRTKIKLLLTARARSLSWLRAPSISSVKQQ